MTGGWKRTELSRRRTPSEKIRLAAEIALTYAHARWLLTGKGLPASVVALRRSDREPVEPKTRAEQIVAVQLGMTVGKALEPLPFDSRCLMRSLVLTAMLARRGIASSLVIGVRTDPDFGAHAWVESGGVAVLPPGDYGRVVEV